MRNLYSKALIVLFLLASVGFAQTDIGCGFNYAQAKARKMFPDYDFKLKALENVPDQPIAKRAAVTLTIPVVFHILHLNGVENISDAQIKSAIDVLNIDFRKLNSDTTQIVTEFKNLAADVNVQFCLASKDPNGKCTNGITRHYTTNTDWDVDQSYYTYTWPPTSYLNIYVVRNMTTSGAAAYTFLPGSVPADMDAIVSLDNYVGKIGTSSNGRSRTLTHEVGHWLGLPHIWGSTNNPGVSCGDDGVTDTPITKGYSWCNLTNASVCTPTVKENIQNYMDYSGCPRMFTIGQSNKMNGILASSTAGRDQLVTPQNMTATGIINPNYNCAPIADFISSTPYTCQGNQMAFTDYSYNGTVTTWVWSSPGASNTSTIQNGALQFANSGLLPVQLKVGNSFGTDSTNKINFVTVMANSGSTINVAQDFETGTYPNNQWIASVPQYGSGFAATNTVGASGQKCLWVNNYFDNPNMAVKLNIPKFDLSNITNAQLSYKYAYAQKGNSADELIVYVSTNCGQTWLNINSQVGAGLSTSTVPVNVIPYVPLSGDFKTEVVSLNSFQGSSDVYIRFDFTPDIGGAGNNLYIDDINVTGTVGMKENYLKANDIVLYPNPANNSVNIKTNTVIRCVSVTDLCGKNILYTSGSNANEQNIDISHLASGVYMVKVETGNGSVFKKLVVE